MKKPTKFIRWSLVLTEDKSIELLDQATKIKEGPGFNSYYLDIIPKHTLYASHYYCQDCEADMPECYMVRNDVWEDAGMPRAGHLCLECLPKRLGRSLTIDDFTDAPINKMIHIGYQLGRREYEYN